MSSLVAIFFLSVSAFASDPLLDRMSGAWVGEGERVQVGSGRKTLISTQTEATLQGDTLNSHNVISETDDSVRTYVRDYWVRAVSAQEYELGVGDRAVSTGRFDGEALEVEQVLGDYRIRSRTIFDEQGSFYEQSDWFGNRELSRTRIRYRR